MEENKNSVFKALKAKQLGATTVSTRKSLVHKGRMAPKGFTWLEFTVKYRGRTSVTAMPVPKGISDDDVAKFREEFIKALQNENPTIETGKADSEEAPEKR